jgi:uncharacterized protein YmfQ (DUF2313 family)
MVVTLQAWLAALQAMLPPGRAFTREPDSNLAKLLSAIAAMFLAAQLKLENLLEQADPGRATDMLADWERLLALPDKCLVGQNLSTAARRRIATQRLVEQGGQSAAYFIALAAALGEPDCTVTEFRPMNCNDDCNDALYSPSDRFAWRVNIPHAAPVTRLMNCNDDCNDALQIYQASLIECPIRERKPAHTNVSFAYTA